MNCDPMRSEAPLAARLARAEAEDRLDAAWLEQCCRLCGEVAKERGLTELEAFLALAGQLAPRPAGFEQRRQFCNRCGRRTEMNWDFDALFCRRCNRWIESTCAQPDCGFCHRRPAKPLPETAGDTAEA